MIIHNIARHELGRLVPHKNSRIKLLSVAWVWPISLPALAIDSDRNVSISDSIIADNRVSSIWNAQGGGVYSMTSLVRLNRCSLYANALEVSGRVGTTVSLLALGGGLYVGKGQVGLVSCNVTDNLLGVSGSSASQSAAGGGGGIAIVGTSTRVNLTATWLEGNVAQQFTPALAGADTYARGGGVMVSAGCELVAIQTPLSVFVKNRAQSPTSVLGGAIYVDNGGNMRTPAAKVISYTDTIPANTVINTVYTTTSAPSQAPTEVSAR
jgi:hypothetical protein